MCVVSSSIRNVVGRYHSVQLILNLTLSFQHIIHGSQKIIYQLGSNYGTVRGVILIGITSPMTFHTTSDVIFFMYLA